MRRDFHAFGRPLKGGQAIDLNVDHEHRTIGPALGLQRAVVAAMASGEIDLAYGFPNRQSEPVLRRTGYRPLGDLQRWVKVLSCRAVFDRWGWAAWFSRSAGMLLDPILPRKWQEVLCRRPPGIGLTRVESFDARFDRLWRFAVRQFAILGERSSAYLNWRFSQCPDLCYRAMGLTDASGELLGYVVYGRRGGIVHIADLLVADVRYVDPLLAEFLRLARREDAQIVVFLYLGNPAVCKALGRFGFWQRPSGRKAMVYETGNGSRVTASQPDNWHLTAADIDTDG
jgi:hypothetical protein